MDRPLRLAAVGVVEINEAELPSTWQGEVRSFSTQEYLVVEDFESYTDKKDADEAVFQTWIDGDPANVARQMHVKINNARILYDGEAENLKMPVRQMWCISPADKSVSGGAGGTGKVLIDDLRLYPLDREQIPSKAPGTAG